MACAPSEDSNQPGHPPSLIRVFADRMCLLQSLGCQKRDNGEPLPYWVDVQADLFAGHRGHFVGFVMCWLKFDFSSN